MMNEHEITFVDDPELLTVFLQETREQLDILDQGLVRLEGEADDSSLIQSIFRAAHTLKGSSGVMGFREMAEVTHAMEDVLDRIRERELAVSPELIDALLQGLDCLRAMEQCIENGQLHVEDCADTSRATARLHALLEEQRIDALGDGYEPLEEQQDIPDTCVVLLVKFADDCQLPEIRAMMVLQSLASMGSIVSSTPTQEEIDTGAISQRLMVTVETTTDLENLRTAAKQVAEVEWVRAARGTDAHGMSLNMPSFEDILQTRKSSQSEPSDHAPRVAAEAPIISSHVQQTVRVSVETLDEIMNLVGEMVLDRTRVARLAEELREKGYEDDAVEELDIVSQHLGSIVSDLHERVLETRMLQVKQLFSRFPRLVRDLCRSLGKEVDFHIHGENERLDRSVIEKLVDPLTHILRNAVDHGMESPAERAAAGKPPRGNIWLAARRSENHILIEVRDDGPGINVERVKEKALASGQITHEQAGTISRQEVLSLIFNSGLSTASEVSDVSGRGVGMDVVKRNVESLGGSIGIESHTHAGTTITLKIPLTLAILRALIVKVGQVALAIPLSFVEETLRLNVANLQSVRGRGLLRWRDYVVPIIHLGEAFPGCGDSLNHSPQLIIVRYTDQVVGLVADSILGHQEIVVKSLGAYLGDISGLSGATIIGNGRVALIIDVSSLFEQGVLKRVVTKETGVVQGYGMPNVPFNSQISNLPKGDT